MSLKSTRGKVVVGQYNVITLCGSTRLIIISLGKLTYEMVSSTAAKDFIKQLKEGEPFKASFPMNML